MGPRKIEHARAWAARGADDHERAHHMLDADADQYSEEAEDATEDGDEIGAQRMRRDAELYCAARDALDAVPALVEEIDTLRALNEHATRERERQACEIGRLSANGVMVVAMLDRIITYAREDRARTPGFTRLARALAEAEQMIASDVEAVRRAKR